MAIDGIDTWFSPPAWYLISVPVHSAQVLRNLPSPSHVLVGFPTDIASDLHCARRFARSYVCEKQSSSLAIVLSWEGTRSLACHWHVFSCRCTFAYLTLLKNWYYIVFSLLEFSQQTIVAETEAYFGKKKRNVPGSKLSLFPYNRGWSSTQ